MSQLYVIHFYKTKTLTNLEVILLVQSPAPPCALPHFYNIYIYIFFFFFLSLQMQNKQEQHTVEYNK